MREAIAVLSLLVFLSADNCCASQEISTRLVTSQRTAERWEEAFVTGNGRMGAMLYGGPANCTLAANHCRLFLPLGSREIVPDLAAHLPELRQVILADGYIQAMGFLLGQAKAQGFPGLIPTDPFHPAFFLNIKQQPAGPVHSYQRTQNLRSGEICERWSDSRGEFQRRLIVSRTHNLIALSLTGSSDGLLDCDLTFLPVAPDPAGKRDHGWTADVDAELIESQLRVDKAWATYHNTYARGKGGYDAAVRMVLRGGSAQVEENSVKIAAANEVLLLIRIVPWKTPLPKEQSEAWAYSPEHPDFSERVGLYHPMPPLSESSVVPYLTNDDANALLPQVKESLAEVAVRYEELLDSHGLVHAELFDRVSLRLEHANRQNADIDQLLEQARREQTLPAELVELMYDAGRYMFICSAGELPPNLQGIWTGTWKPAWSGDFTLDSNLQLAIAHAFSANLVELMEGYFRLIESFYPEWRINAQRTYGCRGFMTNARASNSALLLHWGKWEGVFWTGGCGWLAHFFADHWNYTGDDRFLRDRTVPLLEELAAFYQDFTTNNPSAAATRFIPSYSPESGAGIDATMDVMICREVLTNLIGACFRLGIASEQLPAWNEMLQKLSDYRVNDGGVLAEWINPAYGERFKHRHLSHLYSYYEAVEDKMLQKPEFLRAAREAILRRVNSDGEASSHGRMHQGLAAAQLGMAEVAYGRLEIMAATGSIYPSLMCSHEPGQKIFNVDANGAIPEIINRMLIRSQPGQLDLLPALPAAWPAGEIRGIRARQQLTIQRLRWDQRRQQITIDLLSDKDQTIKLALPKAQSIEHIELLDGQGQIHDERGTANSRQVTMLRGQSLTLKIRF